MPRHEYTDDSRGPRLQKVLAEAGVGSRRACEELIEAGEVTVNGTLVDSLPAWVDPERDFIRVSGRKLKFHSAPVYVMLFKPRGAITTNAPSDDHRRVIDLVEHPSGARLYPVGRLDVESSGLILLTNDGELANKLTHPRHGISKVYELTLGGQLSDEAVDRLERGIMVRDRETNRMVRTPRTKLTIVKRDRDRTLVHLEARESRNRPIREMMRAVGHPVKRLRRIQLGPLKLTGLQAGQWRDLTFAELAALRRALAKSGERKRGISRSKPSRPPRKNSEPGHRSAERPRGRKPRRSR